MHPETIERFLNGLRPAFEAGDPNWSAKAPEADCVRRVEEQYRSIVRGDFASFVESLDDDVELANVGPPSVPFIGRWRGKQAVIDAIVRNFSQVEDQRPELISVVAQGDTVIITARERGRYRATGQEYDAHWIQHFTWKDGRLLRFLQVFHAADPADASAGDGASTAPSPD